MITARFEPQFAPWRAIARRLLSADVPPGQILWHEEDGTTPLFETQTILPIGEKNVVVPTAFLALAERVACFRDGWRWPLLYRVLWRLTHGEKHLLDVAVDDDVHLLMQYAKAVQRDAHKMKAFVRFRKTFDDVGEHFVAFHRPDHLIVRWVAPFFAKRFATMRWTILTPDASVSWQNRQLQFGPGTGPASAPQADELESLWKTYYASIFNPARLKIKAMQAEMPKKHWATLPEAELIDDLIRTSSHRVEEMMAKKPATPAVSAADFVPESRMLPVLRAASKGCKGCELYCNATQTVFGEGPANSPIMFIGEQPGDKEDQSGHPFVGPAGQLLDGVLEEVGIPRDQVYITNAVKHFKFEQRGTRRIHAKPSAREVSACKPWLMAEIESIQPRMIVCLGATAAQALLGPAFRITQSRGQVQKTEWAPWLIATLHPSALLRIPDPEMKERSLRDFTGDLKLAAEQLRSLS